MAYPRDAVLAGAAAIIGGAVLVFLPQESGFEPEPPAEPIVEEAPAEAETPVESEAPVEPAEPVEPEDSIEPEEPEDPGEPEPPEDATPPDPVMPPDEAGGTFSYDPPGDLTEFDFRTEETTEGFSGTGWEGSDAFTAEFVFAPAMSWPLAERGFPNSQVYRPGGMLGGDECDALNYSYPWQDNFCETRGRTNSYCSGDRGHQGQDIRPATCPRTSGGDHQAVAVADGYISHIGSISVRLRDESGRTYWYLHLQHWDSCSSPSTLTQAQCNSGGLSSICSGHALDVEVGDEVSAGDSIGVVSDWFGIGWNAARSRCEFRATTDHLHFELWDTISPDGSPQASAIRVPPYSSLVMAYLRMLAADEALHPEWDAVEE